MLADFRDILVNAQLSIYQIANLCTIFFIGPTSLLSSYKSLRLDTSIIIDAPSW
jgi:hypothetical protein